jgi:hypothetical protein
VLVRIRSIADQDLAISADDVIELTIIANSKSTPNPRQNILKMRVVEIYYGFMDYMHGVTDGIKTQHSLAGRNAYAICKIEKTPLYQTTISMGIMDAVIATK